MAPRGVLFALAAVLVAGAVLGLPGPAGAADPASEDCLACHQDPDLKRDKPRPGQAASVAVDPAALQASVHAAVPCAGCHRGVPAPHEGPVPRAQCAGCHDGVREVLAGGVHGAPRARAGGPAATCAGCHGTHAIRPAASLGPDACAACHREPVRQYRAGRHGRSRQQGDTEAAACVSCHGAAHAALGRSDPRAPTYPLNLPRTCAQCHADPALARRHGIPVEDAFKLYSDSIHGRALTRSGLVVAATCADCHGPHDVRPAADPESRVHPARVPATCGACHAGILRAYAESAHGVAVARGNAAAPVCSTCHTAHGIRRADVPAWQRDVIEECGTCHEQSLRTYRDTFHGKVTALGEARVAKCADCHGAHDVHPAADPRSRVSPGRLVETCATCHPGATPSFTAFHPHADPTNRERFPRLYYPWVAMTGLLVGVFAFFGLHTLLWLPRSFVERVRRRPGAAGGERRARRGGPEAGPPEDPRP
jgi:hypothetical protein